MKRAIAFFVSIVILMVTNTVLASDEIGRAHV